MSINDLLNSEDFLFLLMGAITIGLVISMPLVFAAKKKAKDIYGDDENGATKEEKNAKIVARRTTQHPVYSAVMINMIVFELSDGSRVELAIKDPDTYGIMVEGDCGTLKYQGKKFVSFERIA